MDLFAFCLLDLCHGTRSFACRARPCSTRFRFAFEVEFRIVHVAGGRTQRTIELSETCLGRMTCAAQGGMFVKATCKATHLYEEKSEQIQYNSDCQTSTSSIAYSDGYYTEVVIDLPGNQERR